MLNAMPTEKTALANQKLPTEIIGIICKFSDFQTHTAIRGTCSSVRLYIPLRKVVGFVEYRKLVDLYKIERTLSWEDMVMGRERRKVFQERIFLDLYHEALIQYQVGYLYEYYLDYELCRIARKVLDHPEAYKDINLLFAADCVFLTSAINVGDRDLLILLLQIAIINPAAGSNRAIRIAASFGQFEIVEFLVQDLRVNPSDNGNSAIRLASFEGHVLVVLALLQDLRVNPSDQANEAIRSASANGHVAVVEALLQDLRVNPSDHGNEAIRSASANGHALVVQALLKDPRVDPSHYDNLAFRLASANGHVLVVQELLKDPRVDPSHYNNLSIRLASKNGHVAVVQALVQDLRVALSDQDNE